MDGRIVADALVNTPNESLRYLYASLNSLNIWKMMLGSVKDVIKRGEVTSHQKSIQKAADNLMNVTDNEVRIRFLLDLCKFLKIKPNNLQTRHDYYEVCDDIVKRCIEYTKIHDNRVSIVNKLRKKTPEYTFEGSTLHDIVQYQIKKLFIAVGEKFEDISEDKQDEFIEKLEIFINQLPEEKQKKIKEKLKIDEISKNNLRNAIAASGASIVFAIVVDIAGFTAYTTLSSLIAGLAGIFGITLPFGFYVASSSVMAVATSPIFILLLLSGGAVYIDRKQGAKLKERVIPIIIFQLVLPSYFESYETNYDELIAHYNHIKNKYNIIEKDIKKYEDKLNDEVNLLDSYKKNKRGVLGFIRERENDYKDSINSVRQQLEYTDISKITVSNEFDILRKDYIEVLAELETIAKAKNESETGTIGKYLRDKYKKGKLIIKGQVVESKKRKILIEMAEELLSNQTTYFNVEVDKYNHALDEISKHKIELEIINKNIDVSEGKIKELKSKLQSVKRELENMIETYYGLDEVQKQDS
jgi:hypothetical protein